MIKHFFSFLFFFFFLFSLPAFSAQSHHYTYRSEALAACQSAGSVTEFQGKTYFPHCVYGNFQYKLWYSDDKDPSSRKCVSSGTFSLPACADVFRFDDDNVGPCEVGKVSVPTRHDPSSGIYCDSQCRLTWNVPIGGSGPAYYSQTGKMCPAGSGTSPIDGPPPNSETTNPDGSTTWCDGAGVCVTGPAPSTSAPAPASSAPNNSTSTTTTTTHPATSSSTTTTTTSTTTTGGGGSGDGGTGDGGQGGTSTTESTSHAVTDTPAHESESESKCEGGVCDVGDADGELGKMYSSSGVSVESVYGNFRREIAATPIMSAIGSFFDVSNVGGECPTWHVPGNKYWGSAGFDFDFFCSPGILALLSAAGFVVLALGAFSAFRIALY